VAGRCGGLVREGRRGAGGAGNLEGALKAFRDSLAIAERLAAADRSNTRWQRDLAFSYERVGSVLAAQGKLEEALKAFRDSLAIAERFAADRSNMQWQRNLEIAAQDQSRSES
jgi:tetratricopeptide (TPR) repeat protein